MLESAFSAAFLSALARNALISNVFVETKAQIDPKKHLKVRIEARVPTKREVKSALARIKRGTYGKCKYCNLAKF